MSLCLNCSKPCEEAALFCGACQEHTEEVYQWKISDPAAPGVELSSLTTAIFPTPDPARGERLGAVTIPFEPSDMSAEDEIFGNSSIVLDQRGSQEDQAVSRLSAAARQIAEEESGERRALRSRPSRLKPIRDISLDIQRHSTPHMSIKHQSDFDTQPETGQKGVSVSQPADSWPWLDNPDLLDGATTDEKEGDLWANSTDPFISRARPTVAEAAHIEEEDIRRAEVEDHVTVIYRAVRPPRRRLSPWQLAFGFLIILALTALTIDGLLLSFAFNHPNANSAARGGPPALILSTNVANIGGSVSMQLTHFAPGTTVALTHDIQEPLLTTDNSSAIKIGANSQTSVSFMVASSWSPGFHLIVAEDVVNRDTASAMLQINGAGPSRPPHLLLDSSALDLGDSVQGTNTIQPLALQNSGDGSISWSANSNQPWLLVAPQQGTFSSGQVISIAGQRSNLSPGDYKGTITVFSSIGAPEAVQVSMKVSALPLDAGPMISLTPPLLSFTTTDGSAAPVTQVVTLSNPGQQALNWSLTKGVTTTSVLQNALLLSSGGRGPGLSSGTLPNSWLTASETSGLLAPGQTLQLRITVHGQTLLPGTYMEPLTFSSFKGASAYDTPQVMNVALTIQPHCGLLTSTGNLDFTAVDGQSNPSNHTLSLTETSSCANSPLDWKALSSASWITVDPASGQLKGMSSGVTSIGVNTAGLAPSKYTGQVTFQAGKSTQTVIVMLNLQPRPAPSEPIMGATPLSLNFSTIQGQANPVGQVVTITNNGGSALEWHTNITLLGTNWINATPTGGTVPPHQTGHVTVNVTTSSLTPGNYNGQLSLTATDTRGDPASGSPQTVTVSLTVQPPCTLAQPSASTLLFSGIAGGTDPLGQIVTLTGTGSCSWPLHWSTSVSPTASWLTLTPASSLITTASQQNSIGVGVDTGGLQPGVYSTQVTISAIDAAGTQAQNSPESFSVTLTVLQPCTLQPLPSQINFNASQGQSAQVSQTFTLTETGSCSKGVLWTALGDAGSSSWLGLSANSGTDSGSTITVTASPGSLVPGNYTGQITVSASSNGVVLQGSPQSISVAFQINGYSVSGSIVACASSPDCTGAPALADAAVTLLDSGNNIIATIFADAEGNYTFSGIPLGSYTITVSGSANGQTYSGTASVTVADDTTVPTVQALSQ